jgi:hypothetical protein
LGSRRLSSVRTSQRTGVPAGLTVLVPLMNRSTWPHEMACVWEC